MLTFPTRPTPARARTAYFLYDGPSPFNRAPPHARGRPTSSTTDPHRSTERPRTRADGFIELHTLRHKYRAPPHARGRLQGRAINPLHRRPTPDTHANGAVNVGCGPNPRLTSTRTRPATRETPPAAARVAGKGRPTGRIIDLAGA